MTTHKKRYQPQRWGHTYNELKVLRNIKKEDEMEELIVLTHYAPVSSVPVQLLPVLEDGP